LGFTLRLFALNGNPDDSLIRSVVLLSSSLPGTASGENPAPGTGVPSAFPGSTPTISFVHWLSGLAEKKDEILAVPQRKHSLGLGAAATRFQSAQANGRKEKHTMNLNQFTIIGFIGRNAETKQLPSGTSITRFSVATTRSWKDDKGEWKDRTQWHNVVLFGPGFAQLTPRLVKGAHVLVQGELTTREYDRTVSVANGKKSIEHVIQQLAVELKADIVRILDRTGSDHDPAAQSVAEDESPCEGDSSG
jgi:single-strand DNA-binding protein